MSAHRRGSPFHDALGTFLVMQCNEGLLPKEGPVRKEVLLVPTPLTYEGSVGKDQPGGQGMRPVDLQLKGFVVQCDIWGGGGNCSIPENFQNLTGWKPLSCKILQYLEIWNLKDIFEFSKCQLTLAFLKEYIVTSQEKYSIALKRFLLFIVDGPHFSEFHEGFWKILQKLASPPLPGNSGS